MGNECNTIHQLTPYNRLLVFHGVGSGKTCTALSIAENFTDHAEKKILIISSENIKREFINAAHPLDESSFKCLNNKYEKRIKYVHDNKPHKDIIKIRSNVLKEKYEFVTYAKFAKSILNDEYESESYEDRIIIVDEAHNLRESTKSTQPKQTHNALMKITCEVPRVRLVLLTATPMYDSVKDIIPLVELLNTPRRIEARTLFTKDTIVDTTQFANLVRGRVSYIRSENPITFPLKLIPTHPDVRNVNGIHLIASKPTDLQLKLIKAIDSDSNQSLQIMNCCWKSVQALPSPPTFEQLRKYIEERKNFSKNRIVYIVTTNEGMSKFVEHKIAEKKDVSPHITGRVYVINISDAISINKTHEKHQKNYMFIIDETVTFNMNQFIHMKKNIHTNFSTFTPGYIETAAQLNNVAKLDQVVDVKTHNKNHTQYTVKSNITNPFLKEEFEKYCPKLAKTISIGLKSDGIVLLYSQFLDNGVVPLALALEQRGIKRFNQDPILIQKHRTNTDITTEQKYTLLNKDYMTNDQYDNTLRTINSLKNKDGAIIKFVLITQASSEGINFKNIREIHIIEPWWNMSRIEQIIGRGVRIQSHRALPVEKRNVTIYLHACLEEGVNTGDIYAYKKSVKKLAEIRKTEAILMNQSIDCQLTTNMHTQKNIWNCVRVTNSQQQEIEDLSSKLFEIAHRVDPDCHAKHLEHKNNVTDVSTYNPFVHGRDIIDDIVAFVLDVFLHRDSIAIDSLCTHIQHNFHTHENNIFAALEHVNTVDCIDRFGRHGKIHTRGTRYFFIPTNAKNTLPRAHDTLSNPTYTPVISIKALETVDSPFHIKTADIAQDIFKNFERRWKQDVDDYKTIFNSISIDKNTLSYAFFRYHFDRLSKSERIHVLHQSSNIAHLPLDLKTIYNTDTGEYITSQTPTYKQIPYAKLDPNSKTPKLKIVTQSSKRHSGQVLTTLKKPQIVEHASKLITHREIIKKLPDMTIINQAKIFEIILRIEDTLVIL